MATKRSTSHPEAVTQTVTVADLHAGLHNTLRGFFHGKIDESTVIDRCQFMDMLAYPTPDAKLIQEQIRDARENYQNDDDATFEDFLQDLNTIEQETEDDLTAETNPTGDPMSISDAEQATIDAAETAEVNTAHTLALMEDAERTATINHNIMEAIKADDRRNMAEMQPEAMKDTGRTYETTTLALELANVEPLYTAARRMISRRIAEAGTNGHDDHRTREEIAADALKEYTESILEDQDTRNPRTALLVALANAATARIDWADVAEQISEDI
jgi:hypothetical protein